MESAFSAPLNIGLSSGSAAAIPPYAPSIWNQQSCFLQTSAISSNGSTAPVPTEPLSPRHHGHQAFGFVFGNFSSSARIFIFDFHQPESNEWHPAQDQTGPQPYLSGMCFGTCIYPPFSFSRHQAFFADIPVGFCLALQKPTKLAILPPLTMIPAAAG